MRLANDVVEPVLSEEPISTQSEPGAGPVDLSGGLAEVLAQYGSQVQALIMAAVMPVLLRDMTLGEVLFMHGQQAAIYYPEGARKIGGDASEVIKILAQQFPSIQQLQAAMSGTLTATWALCFASLYLKRYGWRSLKQESRKKLESVSWQ